MRGGHICQSYADILQCFNPWPGYFVEDKRTVMTSCWKIRIFGHIDPNTVHLVHEDHTECPQST